MLCVILQIIGMRENVNRENESNVNQKLRLLHDSITFFENRGDKKKSPTTV